MMSSCVGVILTIGQMLRDEGRREDDEERRNKKKNKISD